MISLFNIFEKNDQAKEKEVYALLNKFYDSFYCDIFNEMNIAKYRPLRDAIALVIGKFDSHDHPLEYTSKLMMYIQARVALDHLPLTQEQQDLMSQISTYTKRVNLSFVYTGRLNDFNQFMPA